MTLETPQLAAGSFYLLWHVRAVAIRILRLPGLNSLDHAQGDIILLTVVSPETFHQLHD
jgi:hypothetical protein